MTDEERVEQLHILTDNLSNQEKFLFLSILAGAFAAACPSDLTWQNCLLAANLGLQRIRQASVENN